MYSSDTYYQVTFSYQDPAGLSHKYSKCWSLNDNEHYSFARTREYELNQAPIKTRKKSQEIRLKWFNYSEINNKKSMLKTPGSKLKTPRT